MSFHKDLAAGQVGEFLLRSLLAKAGIASRTNGGESLQAKSGHDVEFYLGEDSFLAEVKFDKMAAQTGNLAIEFRNCRTGKDSGIAATRSHLWVHVIPKPLAVYVARTADLVRFTAEEKPLRVVRGGGDGNADLYLYRFDQILPAFVGLDVTRPADLPRLLEYLCRG